MVTTTSLLPKSGEVSAAQIADWLNHCCSHHTEKDACDRLKKAVQLLQVEKPDALLGELQVADILEKLKMDSASLTAALLSDLPLNEGFAKESIKVEFGSDIFSLVEGVARISQLSGETVDVNDENQDENLRRMLLSFSSDVRIILLVLAKRLQVMRALTERDPEEQRRIANETSRIYAPLANRLGVWKIKWELEDLSLRFGRPEDYKNIVAKLEEKRHEREAFIETVIARLGEACDTLSINHQINGRPKHIYSIWRKMHRKGVEFEKIFDVRAVRVLVDTIGECYEVLGLVHGIWQPIPGEFDDYISRPKANGYASLHTAVVGEDDKPLEIQIRTRDMHENSERGVAAHWRYKESGGQDAALEQRISWMRDWLEHKENSATVEMADPEFEAKRIYVLSPAGKVIELPNGATAIDFAYAIHTSVGHRCRGAKADNKIISLTTPLQSGQVIEILTVKEEGPSRDWLGVNNHYVVTSRARDRIRQWFKRQDLEQHINIGRSVLEREIRRLNVKKPNIDKLAAELNFKTASDLFAAIGRGDQTAAQVASRYAESLKETIDETTETDTLASITKNQAVVDRRRKTGSQVNVQGVGDLLTNMAKCCKPVPYDSIIGYITQGRGITVHRKDCAVVRRMHEEQQKRLIPVSWEDNTEQEYLVDIQVYAADRKGLLRDISNAFSNDDIPVLGVKTQTDKRREHANMKFSVEISGLPQLSRILEKLHQIPDVIDAHRQR